MDGYGVLRLFEDHAVVADPETEQPFELAAERFDPAGAGGRVAVNRRQNIQGDALLDGADFLRNVLVETNFLHVDFYSPWWRTWSMVRPHSATTCSKGMPPSGFCRK
jgi:hypothetical protein